MVKFWDHHMHLLAPKQNRVLGSKSFNVSLKRLSMNAKFPVKEKPPVEA